MIKSKKIAFNEAKETINEMVSSGYISENLGGHFLKQLRRQVCLFV